MERLIRQYLRILDIDPSGYFIRLINTSHNQSVDLSNVYIRQFSIHIQASTSYTFHDGIQLLLHSGEVVTIYSRDYRQLKFDIEPHIFIAQDITRWLTDDHIETEISLNKIVFDRCKICSLATSDVPLLFINQSIDSKQQQLPRKPISHATEYGRFTFPYCLSIDNIVNPHTRTKSDQNESKQKVKDFDSYARRLTTAPKKIPSFRKT
jgi:hypothetical protein